jgi:vancomycin permeability regulator SanA
LVACVASLAAFAIEGMIDEGEAAHTAIVLGNAVHKNGEPSPRLRARLERTVALVEAGSVEQVLVSGGTNEFGQNEATVMASYLRARTEVKVLEDKLGSTTRETARNAAALLDPTKPVIVVSQYFHVARSRLALEQEGFEQVGTASPSYFELQDLYAVPRDAIGYLAYLARLR